MFVRKKMETLKTGAMKASSVYKQARRWYSGIKIKPRGLKVIEKNEHREGETRDRRPILRFYLHMCKNA